MWIIKISFRSKVTEKDYAGWNLRPRWNTRDGLNHRKKKIEINSMIKTCRRYNCGCDIMIIIFLLVKEDDDFAYFFLVVFLCACTHNNAEEFSQVWHHWKINQKWKLSESLVASFQDQKSKLKLISHHIRAFQWTHLTRNLNILVSLFWEIFFTVLKSLRNFNFYLWLILKIVIVKKVSNVWIRWEPLHTLPSWSWKQCDILLLLCVVYQQVIGNIFELTNASCWCWHQ